MSEAPRDVEHLREFLDALLAETDHDARRDADPVGLVHEYERPQDRETVAFLVSCLAYGRVSVLRAACRDLLARLGDHPSTALSSARREDFDGFVYRMSRGEDLWDLVRALARIGEEFGSLEAAYQATEGTHIERASALVTAIRARRERRELTRGFRYLLPDPSDGSTTKRLHMFFRWVARPADGVDLGLWSALPASELVMPLDTHTSRICRYLGLTDRKSTDLRAALEITQSLRQLRPDDPLAYDFPIAHLGISGRCIHRRSPDHCPGCPIEPVCLLS